MHYILGWRSFNSLTTLHADIFYINNFTFLHYLYLFIGAVNTLTGY